MSDNDTNDISNNNDKSNTSIIAVTLINNKYNN